MKKISAFLPAIIWTIIIIILTLMPASSVPNTPFSRIPYFDKMVHCGIFAGFVLLWSMLFRRLKGKEKQIVYMARAILIAIVFGLIIELLQGEITSIHRDFDWWDLVADIIGAFLGAAIFVEIYGPKKEKES
ncbi:MAG TPA: VanZ family protein [Chitinophagaceae bacterium]|nr:VanZ family protein [Chitinophagaceae bacterium]